MWKIVIPFLFTSIACSETVAVKKCEPRVIRPGPLIHSFKVGDGITTFQSPDNGELESCLTIPFPYAKPVRYYFKTIYSVRLVGVRKGDVLNVHTQGQVTLKELKHAMIGYNIQLNYDSHLPLAVETVRDSSRHITEGTGTNFNPSIHHQPISATRLGYVFQEDHNDVYVNFVVWTASTFGNDKAAMIVDKDYGGISGFVIRQ